jgi:L-2-hydroxyglutarate oxidase LhgO
VFHPGFNYPPDSRKAAFAREGTRRMTAYADEHGIPVEEFGVAVATDRDRRRTVDGLRTESEHPAIARFDIAEDVLG